jgi:hypothetical protein
MTVKRQEVVSPNTVANVSNSSQHLLTLSFMILKTNQEDNPINEMDKEEFCEVAETFREALGISSEISLRTVLNFLEVAFGFNRNDSIFFW